MLDMPGVAHASDPALARPQPSPGPARGFGSDRVADVPRMLDVSHAAPNPGADMQAALTRKAKPARG